MRTTTKSANDRPLVLLGAGGHALVAAESAHASAQASAQASGWRIAGFLDDDASASLAPLDAPRLGALDDAPRLDPAPALHLAIGDLSARRRVLDGIRPAPSRWATIIHPSAIVSPRAEIGAGVFVSAGVIINARARIGAHAIINTGAIVEHDCFVKENAHIAPRVALAGGVCVGMDTLIGLGAVVNPGVTIGAGCTIGAGAVVIQGVADGETVVGVPARAVAAGAP